MSAESPTFRADLVHGYLLLRDDALLFGWTVRQWSTVIDWYYEQRPWTEHLSMDATRALCLHHAWAEANNASPESATEPNELAVRLFGWKGWLHLGGCLATME